MSPKHDQAKITPQPVIIIPSLPLGYVSSDSNFDAPLAGGQWDTFRVGCCDTQTSNDPLFFSKHAVSVARYPKLKPWNPRKSTNSIWGSWEPSHTSLSQSVALIMPPTPRDVGFCSPTWVCESGKPQQPSREPVTSAALAPAALSSVASCINC